MGSPTTKQIDLVEKITKELGINFPTCNQEFNKTIFMEFIEQYFPLTKNTGYDVSCGYYYKIGDSLQKTIFEDRV